MATNAHTIPICFIMFLLVDKPALFQARLRTFTSSLTCLRISVGSWDTAEKSRYGELRDRWEVLLKTVDIMVIPRVPPNGMAIPMNATIDEMWPGQKPTA